MVRRQNAIGRASVGVRGTSGSATITKHASKKQNYPLTPKDVFCFIVFVVYGIVENADANGVAADAAVVTDSVIVLFTKSQAFILLCTQTDLAFNLLVPC